MKKYTNKILAIGLLTIFVFYIGWFLSITYLTKKNYTKNQDVDNPMIIKDDEKIIVIDTNNSAQNEFVSISVGDIYRSSEDSTIEDSIITTDSNAD